MIQSFFWFLLFFLPFLVNPLGVVFFEAPKVILAEVVIEMSGAYFLLRHKLKSEFTLLYPIGIIFVVSVLSLLFHPSTTILFGNQFRLQGTFMLWHLLILALISSQIKVTSTEVTSNKLFFGLNMLPLPALLLVTLLMGTQSNGRAIGTLGEPNALAAVAIFFWPFVWFDTHFQKYWNNLIRISSLIVVLTIIFLSGSRSGLVAFLIQQLFLITFQLSKNLKMALILGLLLFLASFSLPFLNPQSGFKFEDRAEVWWVSSFAGLQSPLIGQGFGNIETIFKPTAQKLNSDLQYQYVDSAHNIFLDYWIEGGIVGLGALIGLVFLSFKNFLKHKKILEMVLLIGLLVVLSFNPASIVTLIAFWWLIGQGFISHS